MLRSPEQTAPSRMRQSLANIEHATGLVVDDSSHPVLNTERPPAIGKHLAVEVKPAVQAAFVKRGRDLGRGPHLHEIAGLEIERLYRRGLASWASQRQRLEQADTACNLHDEPTGRKADETEQTEIAVRQFAPVLWKIGRLQGRGSIESFGCLAPPDLRPLAANLAHGPRPSLRKMLKFGNTPVARIDRAGIVVDTAKPRFLPVELAARLAAAVA